MRLPRFRVRTLMLAVAAVALLVWGGMMGVRSYDYSRRARFYGEQERGWREIAARNRLRPEFSRECAEYFAQLTRKYRRAMWRPWAPVAPDPYAPGVREYLDQLERASHKPRADSSGSPSRGPRLGTVPLTSPTRPRVMAPRRVVARREASAAAPGLGRSLADASGRGDSLDGASGFSSPQPGCGRTGGACLTRSRGGRGGEERGPEWRLSLSAPPRLRVRLPPPEHPPRVACPTRLEARS
jgi:hypothetical protein